ncbi:hypothetical protein BDK51DRAFT_44362, partial [Blyttiomyces helicus]
KPKRGKFDGLSRKQKRTKQAREEDVAEMAAQRRAVRTAKQSVRPTRITAAAGPASASSSSSVQKKKKKPTKGFDREIVKGGKGGGPAKKGEKEKEKDKGGKGKLGKLRSNKSFKSKAKHKRR